jgi:hypothetical protein
LLAPFASLSNLCKKCLSQTSKFWLFFIQF